MMFYYKVWVECILRLKKQNTVSGNWKRDSMLIMTFLMSFNLFTVMMIYQYRMDYFFYKVNLKNMPPLVDFVATLFFLYFLPILFLNYFLIFYKNRYEKFILLLSETKVKYFYGYILFSIFTPLVIFWISYFFAVIE